jgi:hypothetical protein
MMIAAVLAAAFTTSQAHGLPLKKDEVRCGENGLHRVVGDPAQVRKLTELPPANLELTVDRRVGLCTLPVIIVRDVEKRHAPVTREDEPSHTR